MHPSGVRGTYREETCHMVAKKIICSSCGCVQVSETADGVPYELWSKANILGNFLWVNNEAHGRALLEWTEGSRERKDFPDSAYYEVLPGWLLNAKHRPLVAKKIREFLG